MRTTQSSGPSPPIRATVAAGGDDAGRMQDGAETSDNRAGRIWWIAPAFIAIGGAVILGGMVAAMLGASLSVVLTTGSIGTACYGYAFFRLFRYS
jgi:hypothetical protein